MVCVRLLCTQPFVRRLKTMSATAVFCCTIKPTRSTTMSHGLLASHFRPRWLSSTLQWKLALCARSLPPHNSHLANYTWPGAVFLKPTLTSPLLHWCRCSIYSCRQWVHCGTRQL